MEGYLHPQASLPKGAEESLNLSFSPKDTSTERQDDCFRPPLITPHQTRYRGRSGEIYESAPTPIDQSMKRAESSTIISDSNFLELIRASESSDQELVLGGDQSSPSDAPTSRVRETKPTSFISDTNTNRASCILINSLSMAWANNAAIRGLLNDQWGPSVEAENNGLYSTFKEKFSEDQNALKSGQKISDQKMWEEGFDAAIFALSIRVELGTRKRHISLLPYKLRGTQKTAQEYNTESLAQFRRKVAWNEICDSLDKRSANAELSTEFEQIAADFFSGRTVEAEYESVTALVSTESRPYHLDFEKGDRTKVLRENPLSDKTLALFLEDVVMANNMEKACAGKDTYHGLKIYRHDSHKVTLSELRKAPKQSEIITVINLETGRTHNFQDPKRLDRALKAIGAIPGALCDLKGVVAETEADLSTKVQNNSLNLAARSQNTQVTDAFDDLDDSVPTAKMVLSADYPNTPGDSSTWKSVSLGQTSNVQGTSTGFSNIGTDIAESPAIAVRSSVHEPLASPGRPIVLNQKSSENCASSNPLPNGKSGKLNAESKARNKVDVGLESDVDTDEIAVAEIENGNSTANVGSCSSQKKKKGSRRNTVHNGKGGRKKIAAVSSSSQGSQHSNYAVSSSHQPSEIPAKLNSEAQPGVHTNAVERQFTENDLECAAISIDNNGWNEVKTKASQKSKSSNNGAGHRCPGTGRVVPHPSQDRALRSRAFKPEEYPAISANHPKLKPGAVHAKIVPPAVANVRAVSVGDSVSWEENPFNLSTEEAEALRVLSKGAEHLIAPSGPRDAGNGDLSMNGAYSEHYPGDESNVAIEESLVGEADVRTELHVTGLEWAAAGLTSPTKFSYRWRHSSLPHRSPTPSQDHFGNSIEISTTRCRSNSATVLDPRVKAVQFGDLPILLDESAESESVAASMHLGDSIHGVSNVASIRCRPVSNANSVPVLTCSFFTPTGAPTGLAMPATSQTPSLQAHHMPPTMFISQPYQSQGYSSPGSVFNHMDHQCPYFVPYRTPIPSFAHAPPSMLSFNSSRIGNDAHPNPVTHDYPLNANTNPNVLNYDHQQDEQASQREENNYDSVKSQCLSDRSLETQSSFDQQIAQSNSPQGSAENAGYRCSCCFQGAVPSAHNPLYFCPGCGPMCAIRYCSAACLLAHSYQHSSSCMRYPHYQRFDPHNMPPEEYEWERNFIAPIDSDTPERYRQRAFSMYCYRGSFPRVLRAWAIQNELPVGLTGCDVDESFKQVGDYHIFRSDISADDKKFAPVEIICTLRLRRGDPMKEALNRALNACFLVCEPRVVNFLFRLLRHLILDLDTWSRMMPILDQRTVHAEFIHQFSLEFNFNAEAHVKENDTFCLTQEWQRIRTVLEGLETHNQILQCWFRSVSDNIRSPRE